MSGSDIQTGEPARAVFEYLRELAKIRTKPVRDVASFEQVLWIGDVPKEDECSTPIWGNDPTQPLDYWLKVLKPRITARPAVPPMLQPWIQDETLDDLSDLPRLRNQIEQKPVKAFQKTEVVTSNIEDQPEVKAAYELYCEEWLNWAEQQNPEKRRVQNVYAKLHDMYLQTKRESEAFEVVLGVGLLTWKTPSGVTVQRHLFVARANIDLEATRGTLTVTPAATGAETALEDDMLEVGDRPKLADVPSVVEHLREIDTAICLEAVTCVLLQEWLHVVSPIGTYSGILARPNEADNVPRITFSPSVILRRRGQRGLVRILGDIIDQVKDGTPLPSGLARTLTASLGSAGIQDDGVAVLEAEQQEELYLPLPTSDRQVEIARKLANRDAVLVQGPPGTGKSLTIANVLCHLLAQGKRVLITSQTGRALQTLKTNHIPKEMQALCVSFLGQDSVSARDLEGSVHEITNRADGNVPGLSRAEVEKLGRQLEQVRRELVIVEQDLIALRERETYAHEIAGNSYVGKAQQIAQRVEQECKSLGWIIDTIDTDAELPLSEEEFQELVSLWQVDFGALQLGDESMVFPSPAELLKPSAFYHLCSQLSDFDKRLSGFAEVMQGDRYIGLLSAPVEQVASVSKTLTGLTTALAAARNHRLAWVEEAIGQVTAGSSNYWEGLYEGVEEELANLTLATREVVEYELPSTEGQSLNTVIADAELLRDFLRAGGNMRMAWLLQRPAWRVRHLLRARVTGRPCTDATRVGELIRVLNVERRIQYRWKSWVDICSSPQGTLASQVARMRDIAKALKSIVSLGESSRKFGEQIAELGLSAEECADGEAVQEWRRVLDAVNLSQAHDQARTLVHASAYVLDRTANAPAVVVSLRAALAAFDPTAYEKSFQELLDLTALRQGLDRRSELHDRAQNILPDLAHMLEQWECNPLFDIEGKSFARAFRHAQARTWLNEWCDPENHARLVGRRERLEEDVRETMVKLAAAKAWLHCLQRLGDVEIRNLNAWKSAARRSLGRGKRAEAYRRFARESMAGCRAAIPAWIMPLYVAVENIEAKPEAFDVAIIDEASQAGPEALFLQYIASKVLVVGDDEQISPENVGIEVEEANKLREEYLGGLPIDLTTALYYDQSYFDFAAVTFGGRIVLVEHFRCMPEIIEFSNQLCYRPNKTLIPLTQYPPDRLPPIVTYHVRDGGYDGSVNRAEAEAIVEQVAKCCCDPAYSGKKMAVVTLLGDKQHRLIERLLREHPRVGPEEMERRRMVCGNPYSLQGDERNVVFLSMVAARGKTRMQAVTRPADRRRFNVAASRAKEQMWLFHTPSVNDFTNHECLRYKLLEYCQKTERQPPLVMGVDATEVERLAATVVRTAENHPKPFDSWFEVDVCLDIARKGYRVVPQFEIAGRRIDLMIEGHKGRLAVECDGDRWHGDDAYEVDARRQRMLERAGLVFWRVTGSEYYRERQAALKALWNTLGERGIYPVGQEGDTERDGAPAPEVNSKDESTTSETVVDEELPRSVDLGEPLDGNLRNADSHLLAEYSHFQPKLPLPDPRTATTDEIAYHINAIVETEGPVMCNRAFDLYVKAAGLHRVSAPIGERMEAAVRQAVKRCLIEQDDEWEDGEFRKTILRPVGSEPVVLRERGERELGEIPLRELAALMGRLNGGGRVIGSRDDFYDRVLKPLALKRKTPNARVILDAAYRMLSDRLVIE